MKTTQGWGWLAAGVLALGINGVYHDGGASWARRDLDRAFARIAEQSGEVLALATGRAEWFMAKANLTVARNETASCRVATTVARFQSKMARTQGGFARFDAMSARREAALARVEENRARIEERMARVEAMPIAFHTATISAVCPRVRVKIPRVNIPQVKIPEIQISGLD